MPMKLGISTASYFPRYYTEDTFERIATLGADVFELFFQSRSEYTDNYADLFEKKIEQACKIHPIKIHSIHSLTNQFEPELFGLSTGRAHQDAIETFRRILHVGERLGAKYYTLHGATILKRAVKYNLDYEKIGHRFNTLYDIAQEYGIKLCYENVHWTYYHTPDFLDKIRPYINEIGTVLDIKQAMQSNMSIKQPKVVDYKDYLKVMGNTLETVHVCDYNSDGTTALPGKGIVDFVELFKLLKSYDFDGAVIMEVYTNNYKDDQELKESFEYLKSCLQKAEK